MCHQVRRDFYHLHPSVNFVRFHVSRGGFYWPFKSYFGHFQSLTANALAHHHSSFIRESSSNYEKCEIFQLIGWVEGKEEEEEEEGEEEEEEEEGRFEVFMDLVDACRWRMWAWSWCSCRKWRPQWEQR